MSKSVYLDESHRLIYQLCMSHSKHPSLTEHTVGKIDVASSTMSGCIFWMSALLGASNI